MWAALAAIVEALLKVVCGAKPDSLAREAEKAGAAEARLADHDAQEDSLQRALEARRVAERRSADAGGLPDDGFRRD